MPRPPPVYSDFFCDSLTQDVEQLLARFQQTDSVRFSVFSSVWREMRFSDVFSGIPGAAEMRRFCRVALATAIKYFLPPYSFQIRAGGLYLLFAFYGAQPAEPPLKLRLPLRDWERVRRFIREAAGAGHHDVVYVYEKLVAEKAVHFTAMPHVLTFQKQRRPKTAAVCADFLGRTTALQELAAAVVLDELADVQRRYEALKDATPEVGGQVAVTRRDLVPSLKSIMTDFLEWQNKTFGQDRDGARGEETVSGGRSRAGVLSSIKQKSYSSFQPAPRARRHRHVDAHDSSSSGVEPLQGAEPLQEVAGGRKRRPPSLRARTTQSLKVPHQNTPHTWLLSAPECQERGTARRKHGASCSPALQAVEGPRGGPRFWFWVWTEPVKPVCFSAGRRAVRTAPCSRHRASMPCPSTGRSCTSSSWRSEVGTSCGHTGRGTCPRRCCSSSWSTRPNRRSSPSLRNIYTSCWRPTPACPSWCWPTNRIFPAPAASPTSTRLWLCQTSATASCSSSAPT